MLVVKFIPHNQNVYSKISLDKSKLMFYTIPYRQTTTNKPNKKTHPQTVLASPRTGLPHTHKFIKDSIRYEFETQNCV